MTRWHGKNRDDINKYNDNKCIRKMNEGMTDKMDTIHEGVLGGGMKTISRKPTWSIQQQYMECRKVGGHRPNNLEHGETTKAMLQQKQTQANTIGHQILTATLHNFPPNFSGTRSDIFKHFYVPDGGSFAGTLILTYFTFFVTGVNKNNAHFTKGTGVIAEFSLIQHIVLNNRCL